MNEWWVHASWFEFNNCPIRCDFFSLLYFCRQLCMFQAMTPIIRSSYNCNYSFWYWLTGSTTIRSRCLVPTESVASCWTVIKFESRCMDPSFIHYCVALEAGLAGTRDESCDRYGSGTLHPGQVLGGSLPLLSPPSDVPTFGVRCLYVRNDARDPSSERWNCGREIVQ